MKKFHIIPLALMAAMTGCSTIPEEPYNPDQHATIYTAEAKRVAFKGSGAAAPKGTRYGVERVRWEILTINGEEKEFSKYNFLSPGTYTFTTSCSINADDKPTDPVKAELEAGKCYMANYRGTTVYGSQSSSHTSAPVGALGPSTTITTTRNLRRCKMSIAELTSCNWIEANKSK